MQEAVLLAEPESQRSPAEQTIPYADVDALKKVCAVLAQKPALLSWEGVQRLEQQLLRVHQGRAFVLQAGYCAERFSDSAPVILQGMADLLVALSCLLQKQVALPIVTIGRIAGQYCKPRSTPYETQHQIVLPSYRGDLVNAPAFTQEARFADPYRLLQAYDCAAQSIAYLQQHYPALYFSHEILHLAYEQALTHSTGRGTYYNTGVHFPWIGMRTNDWRGAHVDYASKIQNPVAVKIGPEQSVAQVVALARALNPAHRLGRLVFIHRFGCAQIAQRLPEVLRAVHAAGVPVMWFCDPMHGNTITTPSGNKVRYFEHIAEELALAFSLHKRSKVPLHGVHLEVTARAVVECLQHPQEASSAVASETLVDPQLNAQQAKALLSMKILKVN